MGTVYSMKERFIFLDRDGTVCVDKDYLDDYRKFEFFPFSVHALKMMKEKGFKLAVITNQSGVARGRFTIEEAVRQQEYFLRYFMEKGVEIEDYCFCPHYPGGSIREFAVECECRKPAPGLIMQITEGRDIDWHDSYVVGDKLIDVELARSLGMRGVLVRTGYGAAQEANAGKDIPVFDDIMAFAKSL